MCVVVDFFTQRHFYSTFTQLLLNFYSTTSVRIPGLRFNSASFLGIDTACRRRRAAGTTIAMGTWIWWRGRATAMDVDMVAPFSPWRPCLRRGCVFADFFISEFTYRNVYFIYFHVTDTLLRLRTKRPMCYSNNMRIGCLFSAC